MQIIELQQRLNRYPEIVAAYLFGSVVTGKMTPMSDVDIALLLEEPTSFRRELLLSFDVISDVQKIFQRESDVKVLNRIKNLPLLYDILSKGKLIYERDRQIHREFVAHSMIAYHDFQPVHEIAMRKYARSLKRGTT